MKALALKELREIFGITAAALAGYLMLLASLMGAMLFNMVPGMPIGAEEIPFISGGFLIPFTFLSVVFAAALGLRQSAWESSRGTYLFLLHRPVRREAIFLTKLATGIGVLLVCTSLPIVLYALWSAAPGHHAGPFEWPMSAPAWQLALLLPLPYLGAFLSGLRPARWFGTRLLPLIASVALLPLLNILPGGWYFRLPLTLALCGLLTANICFVAWMRDYA
jgi:hypothetical protein